MGLAQLTQLEGVIDSLFYPDLSNKIVLVSASVHQNSDTPGAANPPALPFLPKPKYHFF